MNLSEFDYHLPDGMIAQRPLPARDASRLLVIHRKDGMIRHHRFRDLGSMLRPGDLIVLNDTKVIPARLQGHRKGGGKNEVLLTEEEAPNRWWALCKPSQKLPVGRRLTFEGGVGAEVVDRAEGGKRLLRFDGPEDIVTLLPRIGMMPLPPYIKRGASTEDGAFDAERYQTIYAAEAGAIAAPTAGLHFTEALLNDLGQQGIDIAFLTLHVGVGTFKPITVERIQQHRMEAERYTIPEATAAAVKRAKAAGRRVVAVGTTTTRALEGAALQGGEIRAGEERTSLFISPGHRFRIVDALVTNFHLPRSTLLILVSAFAGRDLIAKAYGEAIENGYRFYSYGDAMVIL